MCLELLSPKSVSQSCYVSALSSAALTSPCGASSSSPAVSTCVASAVLSPPTWGSQAAHLVVLLRFLWQTAWISLKLFSVNGFCLVGVRSLPGQPRSAALHDAVLARLYFVSWSKPTGQLAPQRQPDVRCLSLQLGAAPPPTNYPPVLFTVHARTRRELALKNIGILSKRVLRALCLQFPRCCY